MNRHTRDRFAARTNQAALTSGSACWQTSPAVYRKLAHDFGPFDVDLCGDRRRHFGRHWYGPQSALARDLLTVTDWSLGRRFRCGFSNPPYGAFVQEVLARAHAQARLYRFTSVLLLPMRVTVAFRRHVLRGASQLLFCNQRLIFWENGAPRINPETGKPDGAMFDSIVVVFRARANASSRPPLVGEWTAPTTAQQISGIWRPTMKARTS